MGDKSVTGSGARNTSGTGTGTVINSSMLGVTLNVTAVSGVAASLVLSVQWSADGTTFGAADPPDAFTAVTATGVVVKSFAAKAPFYRLAWAITGTTPSFTFKADAFEYGG